MSENLRYEPPVARSPGSNPREPAPAPVPKKRRGSDKRQREKVISVRCKPTEAAIIAANAAALRLCSSAFLRTLGTGAPRPRERRRPLPELQPYLSGLGKLNIAASNLHQLLKLANLGEIVHTDELSAAAAKVEQCATELLAVIRGY